MFFAGSSNIITNKQFPIDISMWLIKSAWNMSFSFTSAKFPAKEMKREKAHKNDKLFALILRIF